MYTLFSTHHARLLLGFKTGRQSLQIYSFLEDTLGSLLCK